MDAKFVFFLILVLSVCVNSRNEGISHKYLEKKTLTFSFKCCTNHLPTVCQLIFMQDWSFLLITLHYLNSEFNKYSITSLHCDTLLGKDSKHLKFVVSKMKLWHTSSTNDSDTVSSPTLCTIIEPNVWKVNHVSVCGHLFLHFINRCSNKLISLWCFTSEYQRKHASVFHMNSQETHLNALQ